MNPNVSITIDTRDPVDPFNNFGVQIGGISEIKGTLTSTGKTKVDWERQFYDDFKEKYHDFEKWLTEATAETKPVFISCRFH